MAYSSHVPQDPDKLIPFLDALKQEAKEAMGAGQDGKWTRALSLYRIGNDEPWAEGREPLFSANMIQPAVRRGAAILAESKPLLDVRPRRDGLQKTATIIRKTIECGWDEQNAQMKLEELLLMVRVLSCGFFCLTWDPDLNGTLGDVVLGVRDPRQILVDPWVRRASDVRKGEYLIDRTVWPLAVVARQYPDVASELKPCGKLSPIEEQSARKRQAGISAKIRGAYERMTGGADGESGVPRVELETYWLNDPARDDDDLPLYPNGRMVVRANNDVLCEPNPEKQQNPYWDGGPPYVMLDGIPDLDSAQGIAEIDAVKRIHDAFNKVGNSGTQSVLRELKSWVIYDRTAIRDEDADAFEQRGFRTVPKARQSEFRHEAPQVSVQAFSQYLGMCQSLIDYLEGLQSGGGPVAGKGRVELRSPGLLEGLQQSEQVLIRSQARRLESMLSQLGEMWCSRIFQFFTADRLMSFVGEQKDWRDFKFERAALEAEIVQQSLKRAVELWHNRPPTEPDEPEPTHLSSEQILLAIRGAHKDLRLNIQPFSSLSSTRQARAAEKMELNSRALLPGSEVLEELGYDNPAELTRLAVAEAKERAEAGIPGLMAQANPQKKKGGKK